MHLLKKFTLQEKFAVKENALAIQVATIHLEQPTFNGFYLTFTGHYDYGDEYIITRWLGYVLMDNNSMGCLIDWTNYHYFGGDRFLEFFHIFLALKMDVGYETQELIDFFPQNIAFLTNPITKANVLTLIAEDFNENKTSHLANLFFTDKNLALNSLTNDKET